MAQPQPCGDDDTGICPHCGSEVDSRVLAALDPANAPKLDPDEWDRRQAAEMARTGRYPTIEDYRKVYRSLERDGIEWPGDDEIRRIYAGRIAG